MLNPNAAGLDLHKEEIWVCPGGFQDNHEPEVKTFGTLTGELRKLVAYLKEKKVTAVAMEATIPMILTCLSLICLNLCFR